MYAGTKIRTASIAVIASTLLTVTACSAGIDGSAVPQSANIDLNKLDFGNYPTRLIHRFGNAGDQREGAQVESKRIANYVADPFDIDARLKTLFQPSGIVRDASAVSFYTAGGTLPGTDKLAKPASDHNLIGGYSVVRGDTTKNPSLTVRNTVLRFPDDVSARSASTELEQAHTEWVTESHFEWVKGDLTPLQLEKYPEAKSHWTPGEHPTMDSWQAHGPYVVYVSAEAKNDDIPTVSSIITKAFDIEFPLLDVSTPTPADKIASIPLDPDLLRGRTLPFAANEQFSINLDAVYEPRGVLHLSPDVERDRKEYEKTGTDKVSLSNGTVYRTRDKNGAQTLQTMTVRDFSDDYKPIQSPPEMADAQCQERKLAKLQAGTLPPDPESRFVCSLTYDRYFAFVRSAQQQDVYQKAAAQYALLVNSQ
ncbi:DUF7373 family lipoprotein [Antrihabitans cavernicola]|uniref:Uncharacterized protein n=1 Tax=Antrihabitans cavernicola TaxID=2495913 RepID=A0A5A7SA87_9NOCA|nr:hypothetical protein [Spelaeibacter cavernicola]KAA0021483.1 hypothetical protein FOY51_18185 [Spelaeibacter cavernicola]